jgi:tetratricopeptide (TPR) repeat protein
MEWPEEARLDEVVSLGIDAFRSGRLDRALELFNQALASAPDDPVVLNNLASVLSVKGNFRRAQEYYDRAIRLRPGDSDALFNRGLNRAKQASLLPHSSDDSWVEALKDIDASIHENVNNLTATGLRPVILAALGRNTEALAAINSLSEHPDLERLEELRKSILQAILKDLTRRRVISWSGGKPIGSVPPVAITPGGPISDYVVEDRA